MQPGKCRITLFQLHQLGLEVIEKYGLIFCGEIQNQSGFEIKTMDGERFDERLVPSLLGVRSKKSAEENPGASCWLVTI